MSHRGEISNPQIDGLVQERRNSIANALELRLSCTKPSKWWSLIQVQLQAKPSPKQMLTHFQMDTEE